jgi:DNA-binding MltR family transcriptional regulator
MSGDNNLFLKHPEVDILFEEVLPELLKESDRGAVIIGSDVIDSQLKSLFETLFSENISNKKKKSLFDYTGPFGTFSSKMDIALAVGYISKNTHSSLNALRSIRNNAAHSNSSFSFVENKQQIREVYNLGDGLPEFINNFVTEHLKAMFIKNMSEKKDIEGKLLFETFEECIGYFSDHMDLIAPLKEHFSRFEFAYGLITLAAMIIYERESFKSRSLN